MRRLSTFALVVTLMLLASPGAIAQEGHPSPINEILNFFDAPENQKWVSQFTRDPVPGSGIVEDPANDFEHSTGSTPGYTPDHIDIVEAWAIDVMPGGPFDFGPSDGGDGGIWMIGPNMVEVPGLPRFDTYTSDFGPQDGSQYANGSYLLGVDLRGFPPTNPPGRCEVVAWVNDLSRPDTFTNRPEFPRDPAGGTNMAFGIGFNPEGQGLSGTFTLDLNAGGSFTYRPEYDIRGFVLELPEPEASGATAYVGITVPKDAIGELGGVNFYTFCVREGFAFSPEDTGSDQTGLITLSDSDLGVVEFSLVSTITTTTTSTSTTTTTTSTTTTTLAATETTTSGTTEGDGGFPWGLVLGGGLLLAIAGWFLYNQKDDPCADELAAWQKAQAECDRASAAAEAAEEKCDDAELTREDLEEQREELCRQWPPACWDSEEGGWIEDDQGNRITSRDLHMRRMALGEVWSDYKAGRLSAEQVQEKWKEADTPEFREDMREQDAEARAELERLDGEIAAARQAEETACAAARPAREAADAACAAADAAKRLYEECVGNTIASSPGGTTGGSTGEGGGPEGPSISSGGEEASDPCEGKPPKKVEPAGSAERIVVTVDFSMFIEAWEGSERRVGEGQQLIITLQEVARELDLVGDLMSARGAGLHVAGGMVNGYAAGKYVAGTAGVVRGGIEATLAGTDVVPDIPTTPMQAGVELLEGVARLAALITTKVTEWMENYQIMQGRVRYFTQTITATPYNVYECRKGVGYVCVEKVWEIDVGQLRRGPEVKSQSHVPNSDLARHRMQRDFQRLSRAASNKVVNDAKRLVEWRALHEPGPCQ